jgi:hypothetical protein
MAGSSIQIPTRRMGSFAQTHQTAATGQGLPGLPLRNVHVIVDLDAQTMRFPY